MMTTEEWNDKPAGAPAMTANPFAALLRDVPRYPYPYENVVDVNEVLTALAAAVPADLAEAGKVLEGVTPGPWTLCRLADQTPHSIQASYGCINGLSALFTLAHINVPDEAEAGMTDGAFDRESASYCPSVYYYGRGE